MRNEMLSVILTIIAEVDTTFFNSIPLEVRPNLKTASQIANPMMGISKLPIVCWKSYSPNCEAVKYFAYIGIIIRLKIFEENFQQNIANFFQP